MSRATLFAFALILSFGYCTMAAPPASQPSAPSAPGKLGKGSDVRFDHSSFSDVIEYVADASGANIVVNWKALEAAGVSRDTPITIRVRDVTFRKLLDMILRQAAEGDVLTYEIEENVLEITTRETSDKRLVTKVYGIQDLLFQPQDFDSPDTSFLDNSNDNTSGGSGTSGGTVGSGGGSSGGTSNSLFGNSSNGRSGSSSDQSKQTSQKDRADEIIKLIKTTIRPEVWDDNGGPGKIQFFRGNLIVTAPKSVQRMIGIPTHK